MKATRLRFNYFFYAFRPEQWVKNFFVFLPLILSGKPLHFPCLLKVVEAFMLFCVASSSAYLINDSFDCDHDKTHYIKSLRAIAAGKIEIKEAIIAALILGIVSCSLSIGVDARLFMIFAIYIMFNFFYAKWLKHIVFVDVLCLGLFFSLRLLAGIYSANVCLSPWFFWVVVLQVFFFGFNKRVGELRILGEKSHEHRSVLTCYSSFILDRMMLVTTAATLVLYFVYAIDADSVKKPGSVHMILTVPLFYYGIFRYLYLLQKIQKDENPARVIFLDLSMQISIVLWMLTTIGVVYFSV